GKGRFRPSPAGHFVGAGRGDKIDALCKRGAKETVMGILVDGQWRDEQLPTETGITGEFNRVASIFRDRITADGSSGFKAEAGRYHLYVAHNCPWAHRTLIYRAIKKLEGAISV